MQNLTLSRISNRAEARIDEIVCRYQPACR
jgi:hypothetical protein